MVEVRADSPAIVVAVAPKLIDMLIYTKECLSSGELYDIVLPQYRLCFLINHLILNNKSNTQHRRKNILFPINKRGLVRCPGDGTLHPQ